MILDAAFKEKYKELFDESQCIRLSTTHGRKNHFPTVTFKGKPLKYAQNGYVAAYCVPKAD